MKLEFFSISSSFNFLSVRFGPYSYHFYEIKILNTFIIISQIQIYYTTKLCFFLKVYICTNFLMRDSKQKN
jgi:hypothetical protein